MAIRTLDVAHLTTVHPRNDIRIGLKEVRTLHQAWGDRVGLVVADGQGDEQVVGQPLILDLGRLPSASRVARALVGNARAVRLLGRMRPSVVHFHDPELLLAGFLLRALGIQVVYDVHEDVPRQILSKEWIPGWLRATVAGAIRVAEWLAARLFSAIVPATPSIAARFPVAKTVLLQNFPIESELVMSDPRPYAERLPSFAYVGGIAAIRGAHEMVDAVALLRDRPGVRLDLAGPLADQTLARDLMATDGWRQVVHHGVIDRPAVARLLGQARAGLVLFHPLPNHVNAQPNKMFEYMSAGLPVIASDFPLWREIVSGAACGLLVDPRDPRAIADAMAWILDHPIEAAVMGRRGREAVLNTYNWGRESLRLRQLYVQLLGRPEAIAA